MKTAAVFHAVTPPRKPRLSETITTQIERMIVAGTLRPGDALPSERDLARDLGVSRPSLREALLLLESRGLLQARRGGGYGVTDVTGPTVTDPLVHLLQRHPETIDDVLELRHGLECVAVTFAALRATDADARRLRGMSAALRKRRGERDPLQDADLDADFHMAVAEASHNVALVHVMRGIFDLMRGDIPRSRERLYRQAANNALLDGQHLDIVDAIVARDPVAARQAANLHLGFIQSRLREAAAPAARPARRRAKPVEAPG